MCSGMNGKVETKVPEGQEVISMAKGKEIKKKEKREIRAKKSETDTRYCCVADPCGCYYDPCGWYAYPCCC
jgi:hypothetical protein